MGCAHRVVVLCNYTLFCFSSSVFWEINLRMGSQLRRVIGYFSREGLPFQRTVGMLCCRFSEESESLKQWHQALYFRLACRTVRSQSRPQTEACYPSQHLSNALLPSPQHPRKDLSSADPLVPQLAWGGVCWNLCLPEPGPSPTHLVPRRTALYSSFTEHLL